MFKLRVCNTLLSRPIHALNFIYCVHLNGAHLICSFISTWDFSLSRHSILVVVVVVGIVCVRRLETFFTLPSSSNVAKIIHGPFFQPIMYALFSKVSFFRTCGGCVWYKHAANALAGNCLLYQMEMERAHFSACKGSIRTAWPRKKWHRSESSVFWHLQLIAHWPSCYSWRFVSYDWNKNLSSEWWFFRCQICSTDVWSRWRFHRFFPLMIAAPWKKVIWN